jgi:MFS family permease
MAAANLAVMTLGNDSAPLRMTARQWLRLALVGLGTAVVPLDTAVNIAFPDITTSFGLPIQAIQWVVICYVLTYTSLMLAFGRVGDIFGHGRVFRIGLLWSAAAYLLCAAAPGYGWLLFCRFLQGIGASLIVSCAAALVIGLFPENRRSRAVGAFTLMYAAGSAAGPLLGGALVELWGWPAVFWFRAPIAATALLLLDGLPRMSRPDMRETIDVVGAVLLAIGISALLLFFNQLQHLEGQEFRAIGLGVTATAALLGFVRWEHLAAQPIIQLRFFRIAGFAVLNLASVLVYLTSFSVLLFGPYFLVRSAGLSVPVAGGILAASFIGSIIASPLAGLLVERVSAERIAAFGALLSATGLVLIGDSHPGPVEQTLPLLAALLLQGFGVGLFQVAYMDIVMRTLPRESRGIAGSVAMLSRSLGTVTGATLLTVLFHALEGLSLAETFLSAFRRTFWIAGCVSALAGLLVLLTRSLRR